jgi:hypothetical protein
MQLTTCRASSLPLPQRRVLRRREEAPGDPPARAAEAETAILDETDSGLDIDALNVVANGVNVVASESAWAS